MVGTRYKTARLSCCPLLLPELYCHSAPANLQQALLRNRTQEQDDAVLVAHGYAAHASRQGKSGFTGQIGPFKLRYVRQIVNLAACGRFSDPDINESETVDGEQLAFTLESQQTLAPVDPDRQRNGIACDGYLSRRYRALPVYVMARIPCQKDE